MKILTCLRQVISSFSYCGLEGVDMKNPEVEFVIFEDCEFSSWELM